MADVARRPLGMDEATWRRMMNQVPSRFALFAERDDETLGDIIGWGMASADEAVVVPIGDGLANRFSSVWAALRLHGAARPVQLTWIDQPVGDDPPWEEDPREDDPREDDPQRAED